jgi:hypothetical protein
MFRETDLKRAIKGARAAGMEVGRIEIEDGKITVVPEKPNIGASVEARTNPWDEVLGCDPH